jgi:hypothetical protein
MLRWSGTQKREKRISCSKRHNRQAVTWRSLTTTNSKVLMMSKLIIAVALAVSMGAQALAPPEFSIIPVRADSLIKLAVRICRAASIEGTGREQIHECSSRLMKGLEATDEEVSNWIDAKNAKYPND